MCVPKSNVFVVVVSLAMAALFPAPMYGQIAGEGGWQPPLIPFEILLDSKDGIQIQAANSIVTPLGVFSFSGRPSLEEDTSTYFVVRHSSSQPQLFCIGTTGQLHLHTKGESEISIGMAEGYDRVIEINCKSISGTVAVDFLPDPSKDEIARIQNGAIDLVLLADGRIWWDEYWDDEEWSIDDFTSLSFANLPDRQRVYMALVPKDPNKDRLLTCEFSGHSRIQALWWIASFARMRNQTIEPLSLSKTVTNKRKDGDTLTLFDDGSVLMCGRKNDQGIRRFLGGPMFDPYLLVPSDWISDVDLERDEHNNFNLTVWGPKFRGNTSFALFNLRDPEGPLRMRNLYYFSSETVKSFTSSFRNTLSRKVVDNAK